MRWCSSLEHGPFCQRFGDPGLYDQIGQVQRESSAQIGRVMVDPRVCRFIPRAIGSGWWCALSANVRTLSRSFSLELQTCGCPGAMFIPRMLAIPLFWLDIHLDAWRTVFLIEMSCFASQVKQLRWTKYRFEDVRTSYQDERHGHRDGIELWTTWHHIRVSGPL